MADLTISRKARLAIFILKRIDCNDGVASYLDTLITGLKQRGWKIVLITGSIYEKEAAVARFNSINSQILAWHIINFSRPMGNFFEINSKILKIIKKYNSDIIHIHGLSLLAHATVLRFRSGLKIVSSYLPSIHAEQPIHLKTEMTRWQVTKYIVALQIFRPDYVIALSSEVERFFVKKCRYPARRVAKILLGVDIDHLRPPTPKERYDARIKYGIANNDIVVLLPGRLNWNKGHDIAIAASVEFQKKFPNISLRFIFPGTGYQAESIKDAAEKASNGRSTFVFPGYVMDMRSVYFAADFAILPSRHEGFALVVAEAMACGLPVIRTPSGGFEDQIIEGVTGMGIPFNDIGALIEKMSNLLDEDLRRNMSSAALEHSRRFGKDKMVYDTELLYINLTK